MKLMQAVLSSAYFARINEFKIYNRFAKPGGIVFLGDSLTHRYPLADFYPNMPIYNRGIDGDTTLGVLKRLDVSVFDLQPSIVVLQIGTNDLQVAELPSEATVKNVQSIMAKIRERLPHIKILLVSLYPVNETPDKLIEKIVVGPRNNKDLMWMNAHYKTLTHDQFIDVYPSLCDATGNLEMRYTKEGLHLSLNGYAQVTEKIKPILMSVYESQLKTVS
jgi:lysophospholipase L1-like esterase